MEEIEVFSTKLSSTGENVKLFLDDDYLEIPEEDIEDLDEEMGYESYYTIEEYVFFCWYMILQLKFSVYN